MDRLPNEVLGMILDELKPSGLFRWADEIDSGVWRTNRNIKSLRLCCQRLAEVGARHLFQEIYLCLRAESFTKVSSIMNHRLYNGLVRELQIYPVLATFLDDGVGGFSDDGLHTFYEEQAECLFTPKDQRRELNIERFLNSVFASFKNLSTVKLGDSAAFASPRRSSRCRPKHFGNGPFVTDANVVTKSITRAESKFHELQLCVPCAFPFEKLSLGRIKHLRLCPFAGKWSANLIAQCPNLEALCIAGGSARGRGFTYDRLGNELCDVYWPHLKTLSISQLAVGADEVAELLRRHKLTLVKVSLWKLAFLTGSLHQLFCDLRGMEPRPVLDATDLFVLPKAHLFPAEDDTHRELLDVFLHTEPQQNLQGLHATQSQSEFAENILKAPQLHPELENELKGYLYRHRHGWSLSAQAVAQIRPCVNLMKFCETGRWIWD